MMTIDEINAALEAMTRHSRMIAQKTLVDYSDDEALSIKPLFPVWPDGVNAEGNYVQNQYITHKGQLYQIKQPTVKPIENQPPDGTGMLAVYRPVDTSHAGTLEDPIPWVYGMDCFEGKHYSYKGKVYKIAAGGTMKPCIWYPDSGIWQFELVK